MKIIIVILFVCGAGLFAGWLATKIYHAQEDASKKLEDEFHRRTRAD